MLLKITVFLLDAGSPEKFPGFGFASEDACVDLSVSAFAGCKRVRQNLSGLVFFFTNCQSDAGGNLKKTDPRKRTEENV